MVQRHENYELLFTYGLLRSGFQLNKLVGGLSRFYSTGYIEGYDMQSLGSYPAAVPGPGRIWGELYWVRSDELRRIDVVEDGYERVEVEVVVTGRYYSPCEAAESPPAPLNSIRVKAWAYIMDFEALPERSARSGYWESPPPDSVLLYSRHPSPLLSARITIPGAVAPGYRLEFSKPEPGSPGVCRANVEEGGGGVCGVFAVLEPGTAEMIDKLYPGYNTIVVNVTAGGLPRAAQVHVYRGPRVAYRCKPRCEELDAILRNIVDERCGEPPATDCM